MCRIIILSLAIILHLSANSQPTVDTSAIIKDIREKYISIVNNTSKFRKEVERKPPENDENEMESEAPLDTWEKTQYFDNAGKVVLIVYTETYESFHLFNHKNLRKEAYYQNDELFFYYSNEQNYISDIVIKDLETLHQYAQNMGFENIANIKEEGIYFYNGSPVRALEKISHGNTVSEAEANLKKQKNKSKDIKKIKGIYSYDLK